MPAMNPDDERAEVEEANARFYRVFETLDLRQMEEVWAHGEHVRCVHPGWGLLTGWDAVRQSWEAIFKHSEEMRFSITDINAYVEGVFGWVTCTENILSETRGKISVTSVLATNIFERSAGEWRMIHHHASHILTGNPSTGISELQIGPRQQVPWHYHSTIQDTFYVLEGRLRLFLRDPKEEIRLEPGETYTVRPRRAHLVTNGGETSAVFLVLQGLGEYDYVPLT